MGDIRAPGQDSGEEGPAGAEPGAGGRHGRGAGGCEPCWGPWQCFFRELGTKMDQQRRGRVGEVMQVEEMGAEAPIHTYRVRSPIAVSRTASGNLASQPEGERVSTELG